MRRGLWMKRGFVLRGVSAAGPGFPAPGLGACGRRRQQQRRFPRPQAGATPLCPRPGPWAAPGSAPPSFPPSLPRPRGSLPPSRRPVRSPRIATARISGQILPPVCQHPSTARLLHLGSGCTPGSMGARLGRGQPREEPSAAECLRAEPSAANQRS